MRNLISILLIFISLNGIAQDHAEAKKWGNTRDLLVGPSFGIGWVTNGYKENNGEIIQIPTLGYNYQLDAILEFRVFKNFSLGAQLGFRIQRLHWDFKTTEYYYGPGTGSFVRVEEGTKTLRNNMIYAGAFSRWRFKKDGDKVRPFIRIGISTASGGAGKVTDTDELPYSQIETNGTINDRIIHTGETTTTSYQSIYNIQRTTLNLFTVGFGLQLLTNHQTSIDPFVHYSVQLNPHRTRPLNSGYRGDYHSEYPVTYKVKQITIGVTVTIGAL